MSAPRPVLRVRSVALVLAVLAAAVGLPAAPAAAGLTYVPPVDAPVVDPWRPPDSPYGAGNRGIDLDASVGDAVRAAAEGSVAFAGRVGGHLHVVVLHPDGLRTSYSFLRSIDVARGDAVTQGQVVGRAGGRVHFGVRAGDRYLDPTLLLTGSAAQVHLVPLRDREPVSAGEQRRLLLDLVAAVGGSGAAGWRWAAGGARSIGVVGARSWAALASSASLAPSAGAVLSAGVRTAAGAGDLAAVGSVLPLVTAELADAVAPLRALQARAALVERSQDGCTPADRPPPARPPGRRIAVLVAGFGSAGGDASILGLDTAGLGYAARDVAQFSYRGGRVRGVGALAGVPATEYDPVDAMADLDRAATRLGALLRSVRRAHPGVPIDVLAHSQGGLVARRALTRGGADPIPPVANLVTIGTPHDGADLATAGVGLARTGSGRLARWITGEVTDGALDIGSVAVHQLAEGSAFQRRLATGRLPASTRVTSIAARGDLVVPALHSVLTGATNVVVPLGGVSTHGSLPGAPEVAREVSLALAGAGPTCRRLGADLVGAAAISLAEDGVGLALNGVARGLDGIASPPSAVARSLVGEGRR